MSTARVFTEKAQKPYPFFLLEFFFQRGGDTYNGRDTLDSSQLSFRAKHSVDPEYRGNASRLVLNPRSSRGQALFWYLDPGSSPG